MSCLLHSSLAFAAVLFVQRMQLAPEAEPFKWNVTLIASLSTVSPPDRETSAPPAQTKTASTPAPQRSVSSTTAAESVPAPLESRVQTPAPTPSPVAPIAEKPALTTPLLPPPQIAELTTKPVREQAPALKPIEAADQTIKQTEPIAAPTPPVVSSPHRAQTTPSPQSLDTPAASAHDSTPAEPAMPSPTPDPPPQPTSTALAELTPSADSNSPAVIQEAQSSPPPTAASGPQVAALAHAGQPKPAKIDYGWLADLMAGWIEELDKRYPAMLRTEGIQGRVTLTALLHEDGKLSDVRVAKSSGNAMLDQVAVDDVRKGPPVTLSRPLERPHMSVKFSIIYDLKTAR